MYSNPRSRLVMGKWNSPFQVATGGESWEHGAAVYQTPTCKHLPHVKEYKYCVAIIVIQLPKIKMIDSAHMGILPCDTRSFMHVGLGTRLHCKLGVSCVDRFRTNCMCVSRALPRLAYQLLISHSTNKCKIIHSGTFKIQLIALDLQLVDMLSTPW